VVTPARRAISSARIAAGKGCSSWVRNTEADRIASAAESAKELFQRIADDNFEVGLLAAAPIP